MAALAQDLGLEAADVACAMNPEDAKKDETHTVAAGETLSNIAATHGVALSDVLAKNPEITNPDRIEVGQQINLPPGAQKHDVAGVQSALAAQGYAVGPIDGIAGPKTSAALRSFQRASGLNATGRIDAATAKALSSSPAAAATSVGPVATSATGPLGALLDQIALGEGTGQAKANARGFPSGYDVTLGYGAYTPAEFKGKNLTDLTVGQVKQLQAGIRSHPNNPFNSSAVGRYQIVGKTLDALTARMGIPDSAKFTPALQDRLATELLEGRGLSSFQSGRMSARTFQNNIAKEWASVATATTGRSYYGQPTGTSSATIRGLIDNLR